MIKLHRLRRQRTHIGVRRSPAPVLQSASPPPMVPEDTAVYACACGNTFTAAVTATVICPVCRDGQAW
jgi:hypothetical protein